MTDRPTRQKPTFRIAPVKPRNPLVAPAMKRVAGPHRKSESARRSAERAALRRAAVDQDDVS
jgi:hypothetical protein